MKRYRHAPTGLALVRAGLAIAATLSPAMAARWAYRLWFVTRVRAESAAARDALAVSQRSIVEADGVPLAVYCRGEGPVVLLVHGWSGRGSQFAALAGALANAGYRAVAFDAPAHGRTPGRRTDIFEIAAAVNHLASRLGRIHAVVSHSFGGTCLALALREGLSCGRAVCISPPATLAWMVASFGDMLNLGEATREGLWELLERRFGPDVDARISTDMNARFLSQPALVLHDEDDEDVPWQQGAMVARAWPRARFERTRGLGHRRILSDADVVRRVVEYVGAESIAEASWPAPALAG